VKNPNAFTVCCVNSFCTVDEAYLNAECQVRTQTNTYSKSMSQYFKNQNPSRLMLFYFTVLLVRCECRAVSNLRTDLDVSNCASLNPNSSDNFSSGIADIISVMC
jgi:hypothetical protein